MIFLIVGHFPELRGRTFSIVGHKHGHPKKSSGMKQETGCQVSTESKNDDLFKWFWKGVSKQYG